MTKHKDENQVSSGLTQLKPTQAWHSTIHTTMVEYLNSEVVKNSPQNEL